MDGSAFCFAGANNYYLHYMPKEAVLDVLDSAKALGLEVLRTWAFLDRGSLDGQVKNAKDPGHMDGVYFQYWDTKAGQPRFNDGPSGLEHLDFVLHEARKRGLRLVLVLTNNWRDFGGMDQYLLWYGRKAHHEFFTHPKVREAYRAWVLHLLTRVNSIDGTPYAEDPAIFSWELANEPRTLNQSWFDSPDGWDTGTITAWAAEMSDFIKAHDPNHMVSVGDEGFLPSGGQFWTYEAPFGVDSQALSALPQIDFGTYHLYPEHWAAPPEFAEEWILAHQALGAKLSRPMLLEEYGMRAKRGAPRPFASLDESVRLDSFTRWGEALSAGHANLGLFWMLTGRGANGDWYPDFDKFAVYPSEQSARQIARAALELKRPGGCPEIEASAVPGRFVTTARIR